MNQIISTNPATLEEIGRIEETGEQKVKEYVSKARAAFPSWSRLSFKERASYILKAREYLLDHIDDFATTITKDNGKPLAESISAEILPVCDLLRWAALNAEKILSRKNLLIGVFNLLGRTSTIGHQPLGVVGIISPWNYPFSIPVGTAAMALMAGNTVVLKPSSATPIVGKKIEEMFNAAGLPEFVFTATHGGSATGEALLNSSVDKIVFTGSVGIGSHVAEVCARRLIPCTLELGGKDPAIVTEDADIENAASGVVWGAFTNAGQCCASIERAYVHEKIFNKFVNLVVEKTMKLHVGNGLNPNTDIGPMTTLSQLQTVEVHVEEARSRGAKILCGGTRLSPPSMGGDLGEGSASRGYFYAPTVITGIDHTFSCVTEETFGPTLPIMRYEDEMQAIRFANDSKFGLNAYIWSKNIGKARRMAKQLRAGTVVINDSVYTHAIPQTPWGGLKHSGLGRTHSAWGFYDLSNMHHIHTNRLTFIKDFWWYPYSGQLTSILKALCRRLTGCIGNKICSLPHLIKALLQQKL